ncbi:hypothetical protein BJF91_16805 [Allorhizobium taibaishanense]|uniref:Uncharacterized protein n=1 Tax=Allorhizobium taibaishanense TaxID=887144 RepID=A0A1Q9AA20_9HYPH|nr:hypothetical protein BJF91_16805 [Allorhizobium taibaishanense]
MTEECTFRGLAGMDAEVSLHIGRDAVYSLYAALLAPQCRDSQFLRLSGRQFVRPSSDERERKGGPTV